MNLRSSRSALLALGIAATAAVGLVPVISSAQTPPLQLPANPNRAAPPSSDRGDPRGYDRRANRFEDRLERRLDFLHAELQITPAQEQAWTTFANAVKREAQAGRDQFRDRRDEFHGGPDRERPGIVERLERRQQGLEERSGYYDRLLSALRPLYAALSDDQRRAADENLFSPGREDRGRRAGRRYGLNQDDGAFGAGNYQLFEPSYGLSQDDSAFSGGDYRPFERPYGPFDPPYDSYDRDYR